MVSFAAFTVISELAMLEKYRRWRIVGVERMEEA